jgi:hypothetical protein
MSHLVYITFYGETDGVILSRLACTMKHDISIIQMIKYYNLTINLQGEHAWDNFCCPPMVHANIEKLIKILNLRNTYMYLTIQIICYIYIYIYIYQY